MPTYEYACEACEHEFEEFQSITAAPLRSCPRCGKLRLRRLIGTGAGLIFKGSGFYETDYRSESYKKAAEAEKKNAAPAKDEQAPAAGSTTAAEKAESKPDAKVPAADKPKPSQRDGAPRPARSRKKGPG